MGNVEVTNDGILVKGQAEFLRPVYLSRIKSPDVS